MVDFAEIASLIDEVLAAEDISQAATLNVPATNGTFNASTDSTTGGTNAATHTGSGVQDRYSAFSVASGAVEAGDVKFLLTALKSDGSAMPKPIADRDTLTMGGRTWAIKSVDTVSPNGDVVLYELQLRGV